MKAIKLFTIITSALLILSACNSEQKKAEKLVRKYLQERLNDPQSYESVSFTEIEKKQRPFTKTDQYRFATDADVLNEQFEKYIAPTEYRIKHKYRAKNKMGGVVTEETTYWIDSTCSVITFVE